MAGTIWARGMTQDRRPPTDSCSLQCAARQAGRATAAVPCGLPAPGRPARRAARSAPHHERALDVDGGRGQEQARKAVGLLQRGQAGDLAPHALPPGEEGQVGRPVRLELVHICQVVVHLAAEASSLRSVAGRARSAGGWGPSWAGPGAAPHHTRGAGCTRWW